MTKNPRIHPNNLEEKNKQVAPEVVMPSEFGRLFVMQNIEIYEKLESDDLSIDEKNMIEDTLTQAIKEIVNDSWKLASKNYKVDIPMP